MLRAACWPRWRRVDATTRAVAYARPVNALFALLGVLVLAYAGWSAFSGSVYARHRAWGRRIERSEEPLYFWSVIVIYGLLGVALLTVFQH